MKMFVYVPLQERFHSLGKDKLRPPEDCARRPDGPDPRAQATGHQHRVQDQRRHSQSVQQDDEQGLSVSSARLAALHLCLTTCCYILELPYVVYS